MKDYSTEHPYGQYLCEDCGAHFDEPVELRCRESYYGGEFSQTFIDLYCPYCGSDYVRMEQD